MSRRTTGATLLFISALLYIARYLSAAIFSSSLQNWDADLFKAMLEYVGLDLVRWSLVALIAGILYLLWAELSDIFGRRKSTGQARQ